MKRVKSSFIWGIVLIVVGILALLQSSGLIGDSFQLLWAIIFGAGGLAFLMWFLRRPAQWWPVIPAFALLGLAALMFVEMLAPHVAKTWGGAIFLGGLALGFWVVYLSDRSNWWAIIPGGVLVTLALVAGLGSSVSGMQTGGIFFLGLAATFALVGILPSKEGRMQWAFIPAGVLLLLALVTMVQAVTVLKYLWPVVIILLGAFFLYRAVKSRPQE